MRYVGQGFELPVAAAGWALWSDGLADASNEDFHAEHERTYGHRTDNPIEIVNLRVVAACRMPTRRRSRTAAASERPCRTRSHARPAYFGPEHGVRETPVLRREHLSDEPLRGPARHRGLRRDGRRAA